jgi:hypothetical protein
MYNLPDGCRNIDEVYAEPEDKNPLEAAAVYNAQEAYQECVEACIEVFRKRGIRKLDKQDVSWLGFASGIESVLESYVQSELNTLEEAGFSLTIHGDEHEEFSTRMLQRLSVYGGTPESIEACTKQMKRAQHSTQSPLPDLLMDMIFPVFPSVATVESALHAANTELARAVISTGNGACQTVEFKS